MDTIDVDVRLLLEELVDQVSLNVESDLEHEDAFGKTRTPLENEAPGSPPIDLNDEPIWYSNGGSLEFFCDMFDFTPTQFCLSQRESPIRKKIDFLVPQLPSSPARRPSVQLVDTPGGAVANFNQDKGHATPKRSIVGSTYGLASSTPGTPSTPKRRAATPALETPSRRFIMASPVGTPMIVNLLSQRLQWKEPVLSSPGNELVARLQKLLPKSKRSEKSAPVELAETAETRLPLASDVPQTNRPAVPMASPKFGLDNAGASTASDALWDVHLETPNQNSCPEFCPPYSVGAYLTAPLSSRSRRSLRIGLSKSKKRHRPFGGKATSKYRQT